MGANIKRNIAHLEDVVGVSTEVDGGEKILKYILRTFWEYNLKLNKKTLRTMDVQRWKTVM